MFDNVKYNGTVCIVTLVLTKIKVSLTSFKELKKLQFTESSPSHGIRF